MTNAKFIRECEGIATALRATAEQAKGASPDDQLQYDKSTTPIICSELRNLADEIEKAAV